uniref:Uncharacterized protein n=1 Tax=Suricata suricatta TaxID=37032 RepID=A0A673VS77_SURSU
MDGWIERQTDRRITAHSKPEYPPSPSPTPCVAGPRGRCVGSLCPRWGPSDLRPSGDPISLSRTCCTEMKLCQHCRLWRRKNGGRGGLEPDPVGPCAVGSALSARYVSVDSCPGRTLSSKLMLICGLVALLTACLLVLSLWKVRRLQKLLMPSVPDPKVTFPGLFECHQGNFQVTAAAGQSSRIPSSHPGSSAAAPQPPSAGCLLHPLFPETRASPL